MSSLLKSTRNTRALPTGTMRYIRSDVPLNLTDEEIQWLLDNNITTLVDLRSYEEVCKQPCGLAGKDRTGVVSAVLLRKLGYSDDVIVEDYMKSKDNLIDMLTAYVKEHPEVDLEIIIPHVDNMSRFLKHL